MEVKAFQGLHGAECVDSEAVRQLGLEYLDSLARLQDDALQKKLLQELIEEYVILEKRVDSLLKNTLPGPVADEIKYEGRFVPKRFDCTILFTDLVGFTALSESLSPQVLVHTLDRLFTGFDALMARFRGTKIKTIGDAYMAVFGAPEPYEAHPVNAVRAGLVMLSDVERFNQETGHDFRMRIGIHTGSVMAGVVGKERMQFDVFGDNVNIASRFESSGEGGRVNVSHATYERTKEAFDFEERGLITLKNKGDMRAYFALRHHEVRS